MTRRTPKSEAGIALTAIALALALACSPAGPKPEQTADAIYTGGDIVTVNDAQPNVEAVAVKNGRILAVGARAAVEKAHRARRTRSSRRSTAWPRAPCRSTTSRSRAAGTTRTTS
jgi:hypothetical protein